MRRILVVEPDPEVSLLYRFILEDSGHEVVQASFPDEAAQLLLSRRIDLIITDAFGQRDQFGFDRRFLERLRAAAPKAPIILCSTYAAYAKEPPAALGLAGILSKPFEIDTLLLKISQALGELHPQVGAARGVAAASGHRSLDQRTSTVLDTNGSSSPVFDAGPAGS